MKINILGTAYTFKYLSKKQDTALEVCDAYMFESGLWHDSDGVDNWAVDEEMTDWFAIQMPKIMKSYEYIVSKLK